MTPNSSLFLTGAIEPTFGHVSHLYLNHTEDCIECFFSGDLRRKGDNLATSIAHHMEDFLVFIRNPDTKIVLHVVFL